jgi:hypothetical protein
MAASLRTQDSCWQAESPGPHYSDCWPKSSFVPGTIIRTILCETHKRQTTKDEKNKFQVPIPAFKDPYVFCYKYRYLIIVKNFYDHYIALLLWSFSRQGLKCKPSILREECIGIKDHRSGAEYQNPRPEVKELVTEEMFQEHRLFSESIVWITRPQSLLYDLPHVLQVGYLDEESLARLIRMYNNLCLRHQQTRPPFFNWCWPTEVFGRVGTIESSDALPSAPDTPATAGLEALWNWFSRFRIS